MRRAISAAVAAPFALLGAGCGPAPYTIGPEGPPVEIVIAPAHPAPEPEDRWIPDDLPRLNPFVERRDWIGDYDCAQGRTNLFLHILGAHDRQVQALFGFHHLPTNVTGQFLMAGTFDEKTGRVMLEPGAWIDKPVGYLPVGLDGGVSRDGKRFTGRIVGSGCGGFRLKAER
jgi:hypothetical protein